jgi:glycosyltransferase involved in cell wall biosynthesis
VRLAFLQFAGEYRSAYLALQAGETQKYYGQRYSIDTVTETARHAELVAHVTRVSHAAYRERMDSGVLAVGLACGHDHAPALATLADLRITHLVLQEPNAVVLRWAWLNRVRVFVLNPNTVVRTTFKRRIKAGLTALHLRLPNVEWVGAYAKDAALQLRAMGVAPDRILPWDFLVDGPDGGFAPKAIDTSQRPWRLVFAGSAVAGKGLFEACEAVALLRSAGRDVVLDIYSRGDEAPFKALAAERGVSDRIRFRGEIAVADIERTMHEADLVLIPSRHDYPEGCPLTLYHAMRARTPTVVSDHLVFNANVVPTDGVVRARAGDSASLAERIESVLSSPARYRELSDRTTEVARNLAVPLKWRDAVLGWLPGRPAGGADLPTFSLASGRYAWAR